MYANNSYSLDVDTGAAVMKNGQGCRNLTLTSLNHGSRKYRCCRARSGISLASFRCVGKDSPDCPGFKPLFEVLSTLENDGEEY